MLTIETLAEIEEDGTLKARTPARTPRGERQVVIVIGDTEPLAAPRKRRLPDLSEFRAGLNCQPYPGNSVVDLRDDER